MFGLVKDRKHEAKVDMFELEELLMSNLMTDEKSFAACKVMGDPDGAMIQFSKIKLEKYILYTCFKMANIQLTDEANAWLNHKDTYEDMCYLGDWCPYWNKWKTEIKWDQEEGWITPVAGGKRLLMTIFGKTCANCMYSCFEQDNAYCLCGVRNDLYGLPEYEQRACSHFIEDKKDIDTYASELGIKEDNEDDETANKVYETVNKAHSLFYESQGCPQYESEESHLYYDEDYKKTLNQVNKEENK